MKQNQSNNKKEIIVRCILFSVTIVLAVLSGLYLTNGALAQARKKFLNEAPIATSAYKVVNVSAKDGFTVEGFDSAISSSDSTYKGLVSQNSVLSGVIIDGKGKERTSETFVFDNRLKINDVFIKGAVSVNEGQYPIYVAGYEWDGVNLGDTYDLVLPSAAGEGKTLNVVVAGTFDYSKLIGTVVRNTDYYNAYRSIIAVEGVDLKSLYPDADNYIFAFTTQSVKDVVTNESYGVKSSTSPSQNEDFEQMTQISDFSSTESFIYQLYLYFTVFAVIMILLFFIGGRYRVIHYAVFAAVSAITMLIFYFVSFKGSNMYFLAQPLKGWFTIFLIMSLSVPLIIALIVQLIVVHQQKKLYKEVKGDNI